MDQLGLLPTLGYKHFFLPLILLLSIEIADSLTNILTGEHTGCNRLYLNIRKCVLLATSGDKDKSLLKGKIGTIWSLRS